MSDNSARRFPNSAYCCIPLQPPIVCVTQPTALTNVITWLSLSTFLWAQLEGNIWECATQGNVNSVREMWSGSNHRISFCDLSTATMVQPVSNPERHSFRSLTMLMFLRSTKIISKASAYVYGICITTQNIRTINQRRCYPYHLRRSHDHISIMMTRRLTLAWHSYQVSYKFVWEGHSDMIRKAPYTIRKLQSHNPQEGRLRDVSHVRLSRDVLNCSGWQQEGQCSWNAYGSLEQMRWACPIIRPPLSGPTWISNHAYITLPERYWRGSPEEEARDKGMI
jgi:hypothetical protein